MRTLAATDGEAIRAATSVLDERGLVVLPTDLGYALASDALDEDAVVEVFHATGRAADEALDVCISGMEDVQHVASASPLARRLALRWWPGPLALVMRAKPWLPDVLTAGGDRVAVRAPDHAFVRALAQHFGPLTLTLLDAASCDAAQASLGARARLYVDGGASAPRAATVVDCTGDTPRVLREGALAAAEVAALGP